MAHLVENSAGAVAHILPVPQRVASVRPVAATALFTVLVAGLGAAAILVPAARGDALWVAHTTTAAVAAVFFSYQLVRRVNRRAALTGLALVAFFFGSTRNLYWEVVERRLEAISPGKVYKSGELSASQLVEVVTSQSIRTVIDLREVAEKKGREEAQLAELGVRYVPIPTGQVPVEESVERFLDIMSDSSTYPALIHCTHGEGRSVLFCALYRIEFEGWSNEAARRKCRWLPWRGSFKPGSDKGDYLRSYQSRRSSFTVDASRPE